MTRDELPPAGRPWSELETALDAARERDRDPKATLNDRFLNDRGLLIDDGTLGVAKRAFDRFFTKGNGAPAVMDFERRVVAMTLALLHGPETACGNVTSGGTESLFIAARAALEWKTARRPGPGMPELLMSSTGYPSFEKFAPILGYRVVRIAVGEDFRADVAALDAAVTDDTFMILGSMPPWTHGVCDPIADLARVARSHDMWLHVDACVGGFLAPFVKRLGHHVPDFDFSVDGVASISADLHKYGYAPKGASTILFRSAELRGRQHFAFEDWAAGLYRSPVITGTRPAGPIVGAWAVMQHLGEEGYLRRAEHIMRAKQKILAVIDGEPHLVLFGRPELATLTFGAHGLDIFAVSETLASRGWTVNRCRDPDGIQFVLGPLTDEAADALASDLAWSVDQVREGKLRRTSDRVVYSDEIF